LVYFHSYSADAYALVSGWDWLGLGVVKRNMGFISIVT
jgi:hypothetical protein